MTLRFAALASLWLGMPAPAQQPVAQPSTAQPSTAQPAAVQPRPAPVYRVELIIFRATAALGAPEDWTAESGGSSEGPSALDADPAGKSASTPAAATAQPGASVQPGATAPPAAPVPAPAPVAPPAPAPASTSPASPTPGSTPASISPAAQLAERRSNLQLLPESVFQLDRIATRLRTSGRYVPVAHVEWSQTASPWDRPIEIPIESLGIDVKGLTGSVALERGEFLHLALLLDYAMDDPPPGLEAPPGTVFTLHDSHRVRFDERNYFDHPAFGVIALVTPERRSERLPSAALSP